MPFAPVMPVNYVQYGTSQIAYVNGLVSYANLYSTWLAAQTNISPSGLPVQVDPPVPAGFTVVDISTAPQTVLGVSNGVGGFQIAGLGQVYNGVWSTRPSATAYAVGTQIYITDIPAGGRTLFYTDGTNWRPINGSVTLFAGAGSASSPLGTLTSVGAAILMTGALSGIRIPAGLIVPAKSLMRVCAYWNKTGSASGISCVTTIGTSNSLSDSQTVGQFIGALATSVLNEQIDYMFPNATSLTTTSNAVNTNAAAGATSTPTYSTNINTAADMFLNFGTTSSTSGDGLQIFALSVQVFL